MGRCTGNGERSRSLTSLATPLPQEITVMVEQLNFDRLSIATGPDLYALQSALYGGQSIKFGLERAPDIIMQVGSSQQDFEPCWASLAWWQGIDASGAAAAAGTIAARARFCTNRLARTSRATARRGFTGQV